MEALLSKITQQTINYAIRSGIGIAGAYAIRQCSRLAENAEGDDREDLIALQNRLDSKIRIISPAIDMIELISARGNTSLESAVALTKALRWDIQTLGIRLAKAATAEELSSSSLKSKNRAQDRLKLKLLVEEIRKLLDRIEDAVPFINLAITTSGASLSTTLPATVSPSRLLQASTLLTAGDTQYSVEPGKPVQVGIAFTLSVYMLFSGHTTRPHDGNGSVREMTWKEVIHKGRVKLRRVPLEMTDKLAEDAAHSGHQSDGHERQYSHHRKSLQAESILNDPLFSPRFAGEAKADEFAYELQIVEDLEDGRYHSTEEEERQPLPYEEVKRAGIREAIPIYQISKIFYADTGKILNIGIEGEPNNPVLLLKRDVNAIAPRRMMEKPWFQDGTWNEREDEEEDGSDSSQAEVNAQLNRERRPTVEVNGDKPQKSDPWRLPQDLDPEWVAFEVWQEPEDESDFDDASSGTEETSAALNKQPQEDYVDSKLASALSNVGLNQSPSASSSVSIPGFQKRHTSYQPQQFSAQSPPPFSFAGGPVKSSLSLLEMLIRLTALQEFQQCSHLSISDELLHFFLEESSTTGAGGDGEERRRKRMEARRKVGFDPYDESPIKRRGEQYYLQQTGDSYNDDGPPVSPGGWSRRSPSFVGSPMFRTPQPGRHTRESMSPVYRRYDGSGDSEDPASLEREIRYMVTPPGIKGRQGVLRKDQDIVGKSSPLGRGVSTEADSTLGTSPQESREE
ncbi:hypothetical protein GP486_004503 [Trichoglossum hirsutum]|uniref:RanGTP-binding protein n=1 Tax=Trichoglossum hirsutum TaxID=265104 RepID=A0A9P8RNY7_9PEZI|nr:hypothetical protein GP486_004503 [Trichoglossum hirsutum]